MNLERFVTAQEDSYEIAFHEIRQGRKQSHWMWYIFPQIKGLGYNATSQYYAIQNREEAKAYLEHPVLYKHLIEISEELLKLDSCNPREVFGCPDDLKLKSSMTLFFSVSEQEIFKKILDKFFDGKLDSRTLELLE